MGQKMMEKWARATERKVFYLTHNFSSYGTIYYCFVSGTTSVLQLKIDCWCLIWIHSGNIPPKRCGHDELCALQILYIYRRVPILGEILGEDYLN